MPEALRADRRLHWEIAEADGPAVVLVPGLGSGMKLFGTLPRRFARAGFRTLTFDPVGVPPSSPLDGDYDFEAAADDLFAIADAAEIERLHLVGTSLGGKVALTAAARRPDRIDRVVLLASAAVTSARARRVYRYFATVAEYVPAERFADAVAPFLFGRSFHESRPQVVDDIARATRPPDSTRRLMVAQANALAAWDGSAVAAAVAAPTLCLAGAEDTLTDIADVESTAAILPSARFEAVAGAGHSLLLEAGEVWTRVVGFLGGEG